MAVAVGLGRHGRIGDGLGAGRGAPAPDPAGAGPRHGTRRARVASGGVVWRGREEDVRLVVRS